jgi:ParB family chromosome partitioning protein
VLVELTILMSANGSNCIQIFRDAAAAYQVDVDAITATIKQEFAAKDKGKAAKKATPKSAPKPAKKAAA